jgi:hypothetical protein
MEANRSSGADDLVTVIEELVTEQGWRRSTTGPSLSQGRCGTGAGSRARGPSTSTPTATGETRLRRVLRRPVRVGSLTEAKVVVEAWRIQYNTYRQYSPLGRSWADQHHAACSYGLDRRTGSRHAARSATVD